MHSDAHGHHGGSDDVVLYVLAGGRSRRFGSDKARVIMDGVPLLKRVVEGFAPCVADSVVVAATGGAYDDLGLMTIADLVPGLGPVGGLATALQHRLRTHGPGWVLLSPCDLLEPAPSLIRPLQQTAAQRNTLAAAYRGDVWQPLPAMYHTGSFEAAQRVLDSGPAALWRVLDRVRATAVPMPAGMTRIAQANFPDDLPHPGVGPPDDSRG
jgi:molybdopterin-guanine dinucleotide biosynthesis protein A